MFFFVTVDERPELGLRERKKRACRASLVDAAQRLVARDGLDRVTVEEICTEAGVSPRTFFNYFESKDDAVLGHVPWAIDPAAAALFAAGGPSGDHLADLGVLLAALLGEVGVDRDRMARAMSLAAAEPRLLARQMMTIEQKHAEMTALAGARLGEPVDSPRAALLAVVAGGMARASFARWHADGDADLPAAVAATAADLQSLLTVQGNR